MVKRLASTEQKADPPELREAIEQLFEDQRRLAEKILGNQKPLVEGVQKLFIKPRERSTFDQIFVESKEVAGVLGLENLTYEKLLAGYQKDLEPDQFIKLKKIVECLRRRPDTIKTRRELIVTLGKKSYIISDLDSQHPLIQAVENFMGQQNLLTQLHYLQQRTNSLLNEHVHQQTQQRSAKLKKTLSSLQQKQKKVKGKNS